MGGSKAVRKFSGNSSISETNGFPNCHHHHYHQNYCKRGAGLAGCKDFFTVRSLHWRGSNFLQKPEENDYDDDSDNYDDEYDGDDNDGGDDDGGGDDVNSLHWKGSNFFVKA